MKKQNWMVAVVMAVALSGGAALAATLSNGAGQSCDSTGTWHFVNNQTGGEQTPGTLIATFTSGVVMASASVVNNNTQHFVVSASGTLVDASTNLNGRLVLSDFSCDDVKEPPPCDPKTETCK